MLQLVSTFWKDKINYYRHRHVYRAFQFSLFYYFLVARDLSVYRLDICSSPFIAQRSEQIGDHDRRSNLSPQKMSFVHLKLVKNRLSASYANSYNN